MSGERDEPVAKRGRLKNAWHRSCALRGCVWAFIVLGLPWVALWGWVDWTSQRAVEREMDWMRNHGFYLSADEIPKRHIPDGQNAALVYERALGPQAFVDGRARTGALDLTGQSEIALTNFLYRGTDLAQVRTIMAGPRVTAALEELERGSQLPACVLPGMPVALLGPGPLNVAFGIAAERLEARAKLSALDGDPDEALRWIVAMLRISEHIRAGPGGGVRYASGTMRSRALSELELVLNEGTLSLQRLTDLQNTLANVDLAEDLNARLRFQPVVGLWELEKFRADPKGCLHESDLPSGSWFGLWLRPYRISRPLHNSDVIWWLRSIREAYEASRTVPATPLPTPPRPTGDLGSAVAQAVPLTYRRILGIHWPLYVFTLQRRDDDLAQLRLAQVTVALVLHEAEHGAWPETLEELASASGAALPVDPYTHASLHYERRGDGFILYSEGINQRDDGGLREDHSGGIPIDACDIVWECER